MSSSVMYAVAATNNRPFGCFFSSSSLVQEEREDMEGDNELREGTDDKPLFIPTSYGALRKVCE